MNVFPTILKSLRVSHHLRCHFIFVFLKIFFFDVDHFSSLYQTCYNIVSVSNIEIFGHESCEILAPQPWALEGGLHHWATSQLILGNKTVLRGFQGYKCKKNHGQTQQHSTVGKLGAGWCLSSCISNFLLHRKSSKSTWLPSAFPGYTEFSWIIGHSEVSIPGNNTSVVLPCTDVAAMGDIFSFGS